MQQEIVKISPLPLHEYICKNKNNDRARFLDNHRMNAFADVLKFNKAGARGRGR